MILGTVVTAVSALVPARRASGVPPVAAMRDQGPSGGGSLRSRFVAGTIVTALAVAMMFFGLFGSYGKNDSVDVQYQLDGRETVATGLDILPPEEK